LAQVSQASFCRCDSEQGLRTSSSRFRGTTWPTIRVVAQPRTLGYQPDFKLTLKALYKFGYDS